MYCATIFYELPVDFVVAHFFFEILDIIFFNEWVICTVKGKNMGFDIFT
jgi:hypothetical protein